MKRKEFKPDWVLSYFTAEWPVLLIVTISGLIYNVGLLAGPYFEGQMTGCLIDILNGKAAFRDMLCLVLIYVVTIAVVQISRYAKRFFVRRFANNVNRQMKEILYSSLVQKSQTELEEEGAGNVMTKAILDVDDCVEGREEAKNRQRLDDKWEVISGDILGRAIEGTPIVATGTRYSLYDPIGHLQEEAQKGGWAWKAIEIPALDPITDESNYEYEREGKKVFTTAYFREQRELLSAEQFESEFQQQPFEAKGLLFNKSELNYFFELPVDRDPDAIIAVADTAESGKDSTAMPIAALYGDEVYIVDVVYDDSPAEVTKPECARCLIDNKVGDALFESNNAGMYFARDVAEIVKNAGFNTSIRTKRTISNKQTRIEFASDGIKKNFYFKHPSTYKRGCQYWGFMQEVTTYVRSGKVAHDDAPDSLSLLENEIRNRISGKIEIFKRPF